MSNENDIKIKSLLKTIEEKRNQLGTKPKVAWKTNGIIKLENATYNINTINSIELCIEIAANLIKNRSAIKEAHLFLEVEYKEDDSISDTLSDIKLRANIIRWDIEKKKLQAMESKLKDLRSVDAKTEDALSEIAGSL